MAFMINENAIAEETTCENCIPSITSPVDFIFPSTAMEFPGESPSKTQLENVILELE